ncbi:MAG TPA: endonuclease/exonuclease/phosphatase family protein, partial [Spirochaetia bacterium]
ASGLTLMSWNVRNLFDDVRDGAEYREFDPDRGVWTAESFRLKVDAIGRVVRAAERGGPDVLFLQEIENANALETLVSRGLRGMGYRWKVFVPKTGCATNVAIVSRVPVRRVGTLAVTAWRGTEAVRDIVEADLDGPAGGLVVFCVHWKAKTEGVRATEPSRREAAAALSARVGEILDAVPAADVVVAGVFNECVDEHARIGRRYPTALMPEGSGDGALVVTARPGTWEADGACVLYDPWLEQPRTPPGSYHYQGEWLSMDHILLSRGLFDRKGYGYRRGSFTTVPLPASRSGPVSDHLPVVLTLDPSRP